MNEKRFGHASMLGHSQDGQRTGGRCWSEKAKFVGMNLLLLPLVLMIYATVNAEGLIVFQPVFGTPLYRVPGLHWVQDFAGWNRLNLGHVTAAGLLILLLAVWGWVVKQVRGVGGAEVQRTFEINFFWFTAATAAALIGIEALIFFAGLVAVGGGLWGSGSWITAGLLTVLYLGGMIWIAIWHNNFKYGGPKL